MIFVNDFVLNDAVTERNEGEKLRYKVHVTVVFFVYIICINEHR